ncbi:hypothetical protein NW762_002429 [Fusarium torreyae]|uniref:F-box domain-containing protein n=1 Tax=Fusarium torreyae TaxID=1237075 RepID=A0A9W8SC00_9HYPO|nr:hypothetical protein NW762_002429 [Fusarium torreyae]
MRTMEPAAIECAPTHIVQMIGSMISPKDAGNLSRTCSKLRSKLGRLVWSHVLLHCNEHDLLRRLNILRPEVVGNREKLGFVRKAKILFTQGHPLVSRGGSDHEHGALPTAITQALSAMSTLKSLDLILGGMTNWQQNVFRRLLRASPLLKLEHLRLDAETRLTKAVLGQCLKTSLKALHLSGGVKSFNFKLAARKSKGLERLRLCLDGDLTTEKPTRCMNAKVVDEIAKVFPHLKCLILCEEPSNHHTGQRNTICTPEQRQKFKGQGKKLANTLREKMPGLQRFACTLWRKRLGNRMVIAATGPNDDQTLADEDWQPVFAKLMRKITDEHPGMQEVCILTERPQFYHWNGSTTRLRIRGNKRSANFPFGLED